MTEPALTSVLHSDPSATPRPVVPGRLRWLRDPLLHFVIAGGLLFAADRALIARSDDPRRIVVGADVNREAVETFMISRGRKPNNDELEALHRVWLDNEVLYREGLALGVDKGDPAIRERVIFKALSVVDSNVKLPPIDEKGLRAWFEAHRDRYDEPARFDFQEAVRSADSSEATISALVQTLNAETGGETNASLRVFKGRPRSNLVQSYGPEFASAVESAPPGKWQAIKSRDGWRAILVDAVSPPAPAQFEKLRGMVMQDWRDAVAAEQRTAAVRTLGRKYTVTYEPMTPHEGEGEE